MQADEMLKPKSLNSKKRTIDFGLKVSNAKFAFDIDPALKHLRLHEKIIKTQITIFIFEKTPRIDKAQLKRSRYGLLMAIFCCFLVRYKLIQRFVSPIIWSSFRFLVLFEVLHFIHTHLVKAPMKALVVFGQLTVWPCEKIFFIFWEILLEALNLIVMTWENPMILFTILSIFSLLSPLKSSSMFSNNMNNKVDCSAVYQNVN